MPAPVVTSTVLNNLLGPALTNAFQLAWSSAANKTTRTVELDIVTIVSYALAPSSSCLCVEVWIFGCYPVGSKVTASLPLASLRS